MTTCEAIQLLGQAETVKAAEKAAQSMPAWVWGAVGAVVVAAYALERILKAIGDYRERSRTKTPEDKLAEALSALMTTHGHGLKELRVELAAKLHALHERVNELATEDDTDTIRERTERCRTILAELALRMERLERQPAPTWTSDLATELRTIHLEANKDRIELRSVLSPILELLERIDRRLRAIEDPPRPPRPPLEGPPRPPLQGLPPGGPAPSSA